MPQAARTGCRKTGPRGGRRKTGPRGDCRKTGAAGRHALSSDSTQRRSKETAMSARGLRLTAFVLMVALTFYVAGLGAV